MNRTWVLFHNEAYLVSSRIPANLSSVTIDGANSDYIFVCYGTNNVDQRTLQLCDDPADALDNEELFYRAIPRSERSDFLQRFPNALGIDHLH